MGDLISQENILGHGDSKLIILAANQGACFDIFGLEQFFLLNPFQLFTILSLYHLFVFSLNEIKGQLISVYIDEMDDINDYHEDADYESCERVVEKLSIEVKKRIENGVESSEVTVSAI